MSLARGRSREDPIPEGRRPRGVTPLVQGQQPRVPGCDSAGMAENSYPSPRSGVAARRSYPTSEVRGSGREELPHAQGQGQWQGGQPHVQEAVATRAQEGLEELSHVEGQEGQW